MRTNHRFQFRPKSVRVAFIPIFFFPPKLLARVWHMPSHIISIIFMVIGVGGPILIERKRSPDLTLNNVEGKCSVIHYH